MFCPSGETPTWIYTHHNFAHLLSEFYPSEISPSEEIKSGLLLMGRFYMSKVYSHTARAARRQKVQYDQNDRSVQQPA